MEPENPYKSPEFGYEPAEQSERPNKAAKLLPLIPPVFVLILGIVCVGFVLLVAFCLTLEGTWQAGQPGEFLGPGFMLPFGV